MWRAGARGEVHVEVGHAHMVRLKCRSPARECARTTLSIRLRALHADALLLQARLQRRPDFAVVFDEQQLHVPNLLPEAMHSPELTVR